MAGLPVILLAEFTMDALLQPRGNPSAVSLIRAAVRTESQNSNCVTSGIAAGSEDCDNGPLTPQPAARHHWSARRVQHMVETRKRTHSTPETARAICRSVSGIFSRSRLPTWKTRPVPRSKHAKPVEL